MDPRCHSVALIDLDSYLQLRLMYECNPMAMIVEKAGGSASTGLMPVLDIKPNNIHQRTPIFLGSSEDVKDVEEYFQKHKH